MNIDEIKAQRDELDAQIQELQKKKSVLEEALYINTEIPLHASWVGKCFCYKNSYGGSSDIEDWMEYQKIESFNKDEDSFMVVTIYTRDGETSITLAKDYPLHFESGYRKPCDLAEFNENYEKIKGILGIK